MYNILHICCMCKWWMWVYSHNPQHMFLISLELFHFKLLFSHVPIPYKFFFQNNPLSSQWLFKIYSNSHQKTSFNHTSLVLYNLTDAPPNSLKNSNASLKVKIMEGVKVHSLVRSIWGWKGCVRVPGWGLGWMTSRSIFQMNMYKQTTSWLVHNWSTFGAQMSHGHTLTHKIHHGPNLGEPLPFSLVVFSMINHRACTQMSLFLGLPHWESWNSKNWDSW